ncbi:hypothetical protein Hte_009469 [Hypoxylon texense]
MTFGYSSSLQDSRNNEGIEEWASALLREVGSVRESPAERSRPIIFVCHSLGGLVAREAMIRLGRNPQLYEGLDLKHCGLLFLATPHSGSNLAHWNTIFIQLAELAGMRSTALSNTLKSFNSSSMIAKEDFGLLDPIPPYECLYETRKIKIVEADSAGLGGVRAQPMVNVDHRQICRFRHDTDPGYKQIVACLRRIQDKIMKANTPQGHGNSQQSPPQPNKANNFDLGQLPSKQDGSSAPNVGQIPAYSVIQSGQGTGGEIQRSDSDIFIGGGHATGATMSLQQFESFTGTIKGGIGLGATIA